VGEVGPLAALAAEDDDPHGISDSFLYGVSLNRIARPVEGSDNLFVLPSGSEAVATEEIFRSDRWRRLAAGFREVGALLLLVAHADTPGLEALAASVDGVIVAGDALGALPDAEPPLAVVGAGARRRGTPERPVEPRSAAAHAPIAGPPSAAADGAGAGASAAAAAGDVAPGGEGRRGAFPAGWRRWAFLGLAALTVAAGLAFYLAPSRLGDAGAEVGRDSTGASEPAADGPIAGTPSDSAGRTRPDSARRDSAGALGAAPAGRDAPLRALAVANPGDSARAVAWAVYVVSGNTPDAASLDARVDLAAVPVLALTPLLDRGEPWYRLLVGAYGTRAQAESLLVALRRRAVLGPGSGSLVRAPYALLVADRVPASEVAARVGDLAGRGVPVYPLSRGDGTVALYAGAFETPDQAAYLARTLQAAGVAPVLVYRTGGSL
jgi:hypothetical protein